MTAERSGSRCVPSGVGHADQDGVGLAPAGRSRSWPRTGRRRAAPRPAPRRCGRCSSGRPGAARPWSRRCRGPGPGTPCRRTARPAAARRNPARSPRPGPSGLRSSDSTRPRAPVPDGCASFRSPMSCEPFSSPSLHTPSRLPFLISTSPAPTRSDGTETDHFRDIRSPFDRRPEDWAGIAVGAKPGAAEEGKISSRCPGPTTRQLNRLTSLRDKAR